MKVALPGFPTEISAPIPLPDFAELLAAPMFLRASPETIRKRGTAFQNLLLDETPFRGNHPHKTITTGVHIQAPGIRTLVGPGPASDRPHVGWHIDGPADDDHLTGADLVFLLESPCRSLTQFNERPLELDVPPDLARDRAALVRHIAARGTELGVRGRAIPPCCMVTFSNHLHRPVVPPRPELRFYWRARESHVDAAYSEEESLRSEVVVWDMVSRKYVVQLELRPGAVTILLPPSDAGRALESAEYNEVF